MIPRKIGLVEALLTWRRQTRELQVSVDGKTARAVNYDLLTGPAIPGDRVLLNTLAGDLGLGTGGFHFVSYNYSRPYRQPLGKGHIIKLRYTPWQFNVLSYEEDAAGNKPLISKFKNLQGMPVIIGELHSMLAPAAATVHYHCPDCRIVYVMTDGAALPLSFSRTVEVLKQRKIITSAITSGHAFGGDLEAVNIYSALAACRVLIKADLAIIIMGPGNVGTGTRLGFSGMEVGENINRVNALGGVPVVIPRISFADPRRRHWGVSHHTLTALKVASYSRACLPVPRLSPHRLKLVLWQLARHRLLGRYQVKVWPGLRVDKIMSRLQLALPESMGRGYQDDPAFFEAAGVAGLQALELYRKTEGKNRQRTEQEEEHGYLGEEILYGPGD
ncbi:MAG TPA: DUF3866 family protein [Firmicutes bacterium]|nr:DUF3866 family protein [Bacillota bacterium]